MGQLIRAECLFCGLSSKDSIVVRCFVLFVGCLTSQQQASVSQGRICTDNFTCCHTEMVRTTAVVTVIMMKIMITVSSSIHYVHRYRRMNIACPTYRAQTDDPFAVQIKHIAKWHMVCKNSTDNSKNGIKLGEKERKLDGSWNQQ